VIDSNAEEIAVKEARRMGVPVVSVVDTNCDPDVVDWIIPGNDDALRAIRLFTTKIADSGFEGHTAYQQSQVADQKAPKIRRWWTASSTSTRARTNGTRSRKAISWRLLWKPRRSLPRLRKPPCLLTTRKNAKQKCAGGIS